MVNSHVYISVIIPCYNCSQTISRCLDSVLNQDYDDIEVIAINDGSTDNTLDVLERYANADSRVKVYNQENSGPSAARNAGLDAAMGEYIAFVDSDDWVHPQIYTKMVELIVRANADVVICNYANVYSDFTEEVYKHCLGGAEADTINPVQTILKQYYGGDTTGLASLWNKLYRKDYVDKLNIRFDESLYRAEDWWFNIKIYESSPRLTATSEVLYYYWQGSENNLMKRIEPKLYDEWKQARQYINKKNELYGFQYNNDTYYRQLLLNIHSLLLSEKCDKESMKAILNDDFYNEIIQHDSETGVVVRILHKIHRHSVKLGILCYRLLRIYY